MEIKKKNKFFTFIFSFIPGAVEMYMGLMKNGFSIMGCFALPFALCTVFPYILQGVFMAFMLLIWFYAFFHAWNVFSLSPEKLAGLKDKYIWEEFEFKGKLKLPEGAVRKYMPIVLIIWGLSMIWSYISRIVFRIIPDEMWDNLYSLINDVPEVVVAILLIVIGIRLIRGKKKELEAETTEDVTPVNMITEGTKEE
ncbi:hypothetical protein D6856_06330 [Butyrivibrio sp. XB500-5]|uniref:hypothetical protein n=1 Tax=Butyrivibrio sp. XB500-5 TaxID=2364880 RepID=UPI000EA99E7B|nr:hypothetical protein [Butyrivibrio sp. XB500-5]RKM61815.1 hypothetical protein D6856_06330 [Butyrivibrio sp. XB500-5]